MTRAEMAGAISTLVALGVLLFFAVLRPRKRKPVTDTEACNQYIAEMRSNSRQRAAKRAATELLR